MSVAHGLLLTPRGLKSMRQEQADLRDWLGRLKQRTTKYMADRRQKKEIELILFEGRVVKNKLELVEAALDHAIALPPSWGHKLEARVGDTVYLRHNQTIRAFTLVPTGNADPANGRVSILSPIGQALLGRHQGDTVFLDTLDGQLKYEIIKLV